MITFMEILSFNLYVIIPCGFILTTRHLVSRQAGHQFLVVFSTLQSPRPAKQGIVSRDLVWLKQNNILKNNYKKKL